jgi:hypothetical protein
MSDSSELPPPSSTAHVTISGGSLGGLDVIRIDDGTAGFGQFKVGGTVRLGDGRAGTITGIAGKRLRLGGSTSGALTIQQPDGSEFTSPPTDVVDFSPPEA